MKQNLTALRLISFAERTGDSPTAPFAADVAETLHMHAFHVVRTHAGWSYRGFARQGQPNDTWMVHLTGE